MGSQAAFYDTSGHNMHIIPVGTRLRPHSRQLHLRLAVAASAGFQQLRALSRSAAPGPAPESSLRKSRHLDGPRSRLRRRMEIDREAQKYDRAVCELLLCAEYLPGQSAPVRFVRSSELAQSVHLRLHHAPVRQDQRRAAGGDDHRRDSDRSHIRTGDSTSGRSTKIPWRTRWRRTAEISSATASIRQDSAR